MDLQTCDPFLSQGRVPLGYYMGNGQPISGSMKDSHKSTWQELIKIAAGSATVTVQKVLAELIVMRPKYWPAVIVSNRDAEKFVTMMEFIILGCQAQTQEIKRSVTDLTRVGKSVDRTCEKLQRQLASKDYRIATGPDYFPAASTINDVILELGSTLARFRAANSAVCEKATYQHESLFQARYSETQKRAFISRALAEQYRSYFRLRLKSLAKKRDFSTELVSHFFNSPTVNSKFNFTNTSSAHGTSRESIKQSRYRERKQSGNKK